MKKKDTNTQSTKTPPNHCFSILISQPFFFFSKQHDSFLCATKRRKKSLPPPKNTRSNIPTASIHKRPQHSYPSMVSCSHGGGVFHHHVTRAHTHTLSLNGKEGERHPLSPPGRLAASSLLVFSSLGGKKTKNTSEAPNVAALTCHGQKRRGANNAGRVQSSSTEGATGRRPHARRK